MEYFVLLGIAAVVASMSGVVKVSLKNIRFSLINISVNSPDRRD